MNPISFAGNPLERASAMRPGEAWIAARRQAGLFLPFWQNRPFVIADRAGFRPWDTRWEGATTVFLGLDGAQPLFAVEIGGETEPMLDGGSFMEMRAAAFILPGRDTAIAGQARALLDWHRRHGFCSNCGHATVFADGGYRRTCPNCGAEHFPRTDPVVIMLPIFGDACLIGHGARFPEKLFSAFAGFVEPGETMEEAVRRELMEEANLKVGAVTYHASQPWPFPSSLMLGCYAQAVSRDFKVDGVEVTEARWLTKAEARRRLADGTLDDMKMPGTIAIAHTLIRDWAA
jgi:NAD+ diphosphatase